jgi:ZIP family zinc transporter
MVTGILIPLLGTTVGAASVFFVKNEIHPFVERILLGFASGVMIAASVWSLLIPAMELECGMGSLRFVPAVIGVAAGMIFLLAVDRLIPHLHLGAELPEGPHSRLARTTMLVLAVTIHNLPEGMAVGVAFAGAMNGQAGISLAAAYALAAGIAIQNFPEGAIVSLPLRSAGKSRSHAFLLGALSGVVEPVGAVLTVALARFVTPVLPYLLAYAAGAMIYVVVEELIPESSGGEQADFGTVGFAAGFLLMMSLDVAFG